MLNVVPSYNKLSDPFATLPSVLVTKIVLALAVPNAKEPDPTTASIVITLSLRAIVAFAPACSL